MSTAETKNAEEAQKDLIQALKESENDNYEGMGRLPVKRLSHDEQADGRACRRAVDWHRD